MVPIPTWTAPADPRLDVDLTVCLEGPTPEPRPFQRTVSGRFWKTAHSATVRSQQSDNRKQASTWAKRQVLRKKDDGVKKIEKEMKDEKEADILRRKTITQERNKAQAEKARLEEMATRMSARKLQRMKKRLGRTKKISA